MHMGIMPLTWIPKQHIPHESLLHNWHLHQIQMKHIINELITVFKMFESKIISQILLFGIYL